MNKLYISYHLLESLLFFLVFVSFDFLNNQYETSLLNFFKPRKTEDSQIPIIK